MNPQLPDSFDAARPHLRPLLRGRWHFEMPRLQAETQEVFYDGHLATMPFSHDAVVALGYDTADRTDYVVPAQLATWKISFQEGLRQAMQNLRAIETPPFHELESGVRMGGWADGYDTSRILLPEVMRQCGIADDLVLMIPSRRVGILAAPAGSVDAQLHMLAHARSWIEEHGGLISTAMFRYQDRRVTSYMPSNAHLATKLGDLQKIGASALYAEQKEVLKALHARQGRDLFVASYSVAERPNGWLTACSWTKGVTALLPRTDLVSMVIVDPRGGDQHRTKILDWETMRGLAGERLQPVDGFPPRFKVSDFPSDDELARTPAARL